MDPLSFSFPSDLSLQSYAPFSTFALYSNVDDLINFSLNSVNI